jgi:hypothetical protein
VKAKYKDKKKTYWKMKAKYKDKKKTVDHGPGPLELWALVPSNHWNHGSYAPAPRRREDNIKMDVWKKDCKVQRWMEQSQDRVQ